VISNDRHKQTQVRGLALQNPTAPRVIRVPYPSYWPAASTQPIHEVYPNSRISKAVMIV